jgi:hypothetical protein
MKVLPAQATACNKQRGRRVAKKVAKEKEASSLPPTNSRHFSR